MCKGEKSPRHHFVLTSISFLDVVAKHPSLFFPSKSYPYQLVQDPDLQRLIHPWEEASEKTPASPLAGVGCLADRLTQLQTQVMSTTPSNFFSYMDTVHTPIHLPDSHHDFPCQDDATMTSTTDREGLPHSGASSSSKHTAASGVPSTFGLQASGNRWKVMCRVDQASKKLRQFRTDNLQQQRFLVHSREGREIETQTLCYRQ